MNFWVPAAIRLAFLPILAALVWYWFGLVAAALFLAFSCAGLVILQLAYLFRLSQWLENPQSRLPDAWGAWTDVFARIYRIRREDERNRQELAEWLARFRQAMSLLPDGVVIMDDVLFLEWCNPLAEHHLGLVLERDQGMRVTNLVRTPAFIDYIVLGRYDEPLSLSFRDRKLVVHVIPFENRRQILVTHDVTATEQAELMRRDFVANASHELRTPLTVINGFLEFAANPAIDPETRLEHVRLMSEQGKRMQNLVNDMLALTRLESPDYPLRAEPVDMRQLLDSVLQEARALSGARHEITLHCAGPDMMGNADELRSAFSNLVSNAVRYTGDGGKISLTWEVSAEGLLFSVADNGIGINAEHLARLTERFYRVDKSRSRETQGTGLGLAIVKHVLLRHGGMLGISSTPGQGSVFRASLPLESQRVSAIAQDTQDARH